MKKDINEENEKLAEIRSSEENIHKFLLRSRRAINTILKNFKIRVCKSQIEDIKQQAFLALLEWVRSEKVLKDCALSTKVYWIVKDSIIKSLKKNNEVDLKKAKNKVDKYDHSNIITAMDLIKLKNKVSEDQYRMLLEIVVSGKGLSELMKDCGYSQRFIESTIKTIKKEVEKSEKA